MQKNSRKHINNIKKKSKPFIYLLAFLLFSLITIQAFSDSDNDDVVQSFSDINDAIAQAMDTLQGHIDTATSLRDDTLISVDGADISPDRFWATQADIDIFNAAIDAAQVAFNNAIPQPRTVTINRTIDSAGGTVTLNGSIIAPNTPVVVEVGSTVRIIATPNTGNTFAWWFVQSGGIPINYSTVADRTFTMPDTDVVVNAHFNVLPPTYAVTVLQGGTGNGTSSANPTSATQGTFISLGASPMANSTFVRWEVVSGNVTINSPTSRSTYFFMPNTPVTVRAIFDRTLQRRTSTRIVNFSGQMGLSLGPARTGDSNILSFNVNNLPADAQVTSITVNPGTSTQTQFPEGVIVPNFIRVTSSSRAGEDLQMEWRGVVNTTVSDSTHFAERDANALWTVSWNGTNSSNVNNGNRGFSNVTLTINYYYFE